MYLHCHTPGCGWSQDDFWNDHYNPIRTLMDWEKYLLDPQKRESQFTNDSLFLKKHGHITMREYIAKELENKARQIRDMNVPTYEEWVKIKDTWKCPKCGKSNWDID